VRFSRCQLTDRPYEIPRSFSLDKHLGNAWRMIRGSQTYDVELWFDPQFAENVEDTRWHKTQKIVWQDDQSILFRCRVDGLDEIVWWVLGMGPHCIVKKPRELADRVKELAEQIVKRYAKM
jgi:proteasome accessory factor B